MDGVARRMGAFARQSGERLAARRWLLLVLTLIVGLLGVFDALAWDAGLLGLAAFALAAALLPQHPIAREAAETVQPASEVSGAIERYQDLVHRLPQPALLLARDGTIRFYNARAREQFTGLRRGSPVSSVIRHPAFLDALAAAGEGRKPATVYFSQRVPIERHIEATVAGLPGERPPASAGPIIFVSLHDLTEQERINQMRADFIANASHELRTPLASLLGFIETLRGPAERDAAARTRFLGIMEAQAQRMSRLIDDLLSLSRVEMNVHLQPQGRVEIDETIRYVADTLDPLATERNIRLGVDAGPEKIFVRGERDELVQLFQNLIQNAIKYGREGGRVTVRVEAKPVSAGRTRGTRVAVSVIDDGIGIAPEHLPRLTERFYRVDVASSRDKGGTGLGLAIAKHILTRHRGELQITSKPGKGSTFTVLLPVKDTAGAESAPETERITIET